MKYYKNCILLFTFALLFIQCTPEKEAPDVDTPISFTQKVNPFIGTGGKGKTYPGATLPYGMVQLSPDNGRNGWDWISGYFYPDTVIAGFSHLHLSGTGAGDLYDISFFPTSGSVKQVQLDDINQNPTVYSVFSHEEEKANPGYYQVVLKDYAINVELTATMRTGLQRYTFSKEDAKVRLHLGYTRNWDKVTAGFIQVLNDTTVVGYRKSTGWATDQRVYFTSIFSKPIQGFELYNNNEIIEQDSLSGLDLLTILDFSGQKEVMVKTGISSVSIENALLNLETEQNGFDFEKVRQEADQLWEQALRKVEIKASPENEEQFYTAMYHSMLAPTTFSDVNGAYKGADGNIRQSTDHPRYTLFSLWDTYRALHPWMTIIHEDKIPGLINSLLLFYEENGKLPVWNMHGNETNMMIGYHAVPVVVDAYQKGITGFDTDLAYEAIKTSAMQSEFGVKEYRELGYIPHELRNWNVSITMEYAYDDWCIGQMAKALGKDQDATYFNKRALNYQNHFDPQTGFFRAKSKDGSFKESFDPLLYEPGDYCEANAWQYYWYVPHNLTNLVELSGGSVAFENKLDSLFSTEQPPGESPEWISGYIGQYVHGNEPSHHVPYLYNIIDKPEKTQQRIRQIMDELYTTQPEGLCGNEDCGQMSAWYLFSALGFYPVNPADGKYFLGSPEVEEATLHLPNGNKFRVIANNQSKDHIYVKSVQLNGQPLDTYFITHEQIVGGGELVFEMSNTMNQ